MPKSAKHGAGAMLAEAFMLRLEAIARNTEAQAAAGGDQRFVPILLPGKTAKKSAADK
jgi:hypothetical protein